MKTTREFYRPKNMEKVISMTGTELYMSTDNTVKYPFKAIGFSGKKAMYDFYYCFPTIEKRAEYVNKWEDGLKARAKTMLDRREARKVPTTVEVGDIMYSSWGYDQTNIDWYQVTKVIGSHTVEIRKIHGEATPDELQDRGTTVPKKDSFVLDAKPMVKRVHNNSITIDSYAHAWIWDGRSKYYSTYA